MRRSKAVFEVRYGTCVQMDETGAVLLLGPSGSGKSDLALRLVSGGAKLVADDQVELAIDPSSRLRRQVHASAPGGLKGLLEVRGVGIIKVKSVKSSIVRLVVNLAVRDKIERLPEPELAYIHDVALPVMCLHAFDASAADKLRMAWKTLHDGNMVSGIFVK